MRLSDESTAKFEIKLVDKQIQKIKQAKKDCQTHYGKQLGCGTCKALQLCAWIDKLVDTIEALQKYIKTLQKENTGWQKRYYELDTGHSKLFKDFCKLQQENEQLRAQVAAMKTAICNMCRGKECDNCAFGDANITETIKHWRPERVCLCGSTRFFRAFDDWNFRFTLEGKIVLTIGCNTKSDKGLGLTDEDKIKLDELHKRKIDLADWIFVIDVGGYIGSSTQSEIEYAQLHGKPIKYLSKEFPDYQEPADYHNPADVAEIEQLRAQVARMREALEKAREALDYWRELYGIGLEVLNWHMNGNTEPFDSFYDNSGTYEALAEIDKAIYALRKGMLIDEARTIEIMRGGREK